MSNPRIYTNQVLAAGSELELEEGPSRHLAGSLRLEAGTFESEIGPEFCHSVDVVQGGFVTAMLDITMTHVAFAL